MHMSTAWMHICPATQPCSSMCIPPFEKREIYSTTTRARTLTLTSLPFLGREALRLFH